MAVPNQAADEPPGPPSAGPPPAPGVDASPPAKSPWQAAPKGGAPLGNGNHLTAGLHANRRQQLTRLVLGKLPKSLARVEMDAYGYRRAIEAAVVEAHGSISLTMAHAIDAAARWFRHGQAAAAWLIDHEGELDPAGKLSFSKAIADSATARDKAIERLRLDRAASDPWAALDAELARQGPSEAATRDLGQQTTKVAAQAADAAGAKPDALADGSVNGRPDGTAAPPEVPWDAAPPDGRPEVLP